ncbi:MAG: UDP-N-acetylmuramoyl-tripeptide--D-alanyl-D-alanine ligase [Desulfovibrionaceae bacterium]|nr:UDP-N-acetylmuramoyl-tripeptide--D-alanyl-D-alanine ligase [Desulfovibrionaceae bacterium]
MQLDLQTIARAVGRPCAEDASGVLITMAVSDSREVLPGALFACVRGERVDGHDYAVRACEAGARAVLAEREPEGLAERFPEVPVLIVDDTIRALGQIARAWRDRYTGTVIGLTGTAGKTTTKEWLSAVLGMSGEVARTEGNHNNQLGLPLSMLAATGRERFWVFECGVSHPGDMEELGDILHPDLGIVLNVGEGHTEGLGEKGVAWHKTRLFTRLADGGLAAASADYPDLAARALEACPDTFFFSCGAPAADLPAGQPACRVAPAPEAGENAFAVSFSLPDRHDSLTVSLPMGGPAAAENLACIALVCALLHTDTGHIGEGLRRAVVPGHRYRRVEIGGSLVIDDCYNANPLSMSRMLEAAAGEAGRRGSAFACVLGEMGELGQVSEEAHRRLGEQLRALAPVFCAWKGGHAEDVAAGLGEETPFFTFADDAELEGVVSALAPAIGEDLTVLVKGSRSNRLETAVAALGNVLKQACAGSAEDGGASAAKPRSGEGR